MKRLLSLLLVLLSPAILRADPADDPLTDGHMTGKLPEYHVANTAAPALTEGSLVQNELFWPYQTVLTRPSKSLPAGSLGVLIRVESERAARVDFGRDGLYDVPIAATDLVERANAIRLGKAEKLAPNFLLAIGPRLLDSRSPVVKAFEFKEAATHHVFLCVFADPWRKEFLEISTGLERLRARPDVLTILFPQSHRPDSQVSGQLRAMQWTPPFVYAHLAEPYTHSLLDANTPLPAVLLQTGDGRVLYEGRFSSDVIAKLDALLRSPVAAGE
jgi:hypothetical protein